MYNVAPIFIIIFYKIPQMQSYELVAVAQKLKSEPVTTSTLSQIIHLDHQESRNINLIVECLRRYDLIDLSKKYEVLSNLQNTSVWQQLSRSQNIELKTQLIQLAADFLDIYQQICLAVSGDINQSADIIKDLIINCFASPNICYTTVGIELFLIVSTSGEVDLQKDLALAETVLESVLTNDDYNILIKGASILSQMSGQISKSTAKLFRRYGCLLVNAIAKQTTKLRKLELLQFVKTIISDNHMIIADSLEKLIPELKTIFQLSEGTEARDVITILCQISYKFPSFYKKNQTCFLILLETIFLEMMKISQTIDEKWLNPEPNVVYVPQNDPNQEPVVYGMEILDGILNDLDCKALFVVFKSSIDGMSTNADWRYKYAALMALSQISEYLKRKSDIRQILEIIFRYVKDPNPRIRFACFQVIGQTVDDKREIVFKLFFDKLLETIIDGFNDPVINVKAHAFSCFTNFAEKCQYRKIKPYIASILDKASALLTSQIPSVVECALGTVHEIFGILDDKLETINYQPILFLLESLMNCPFQQVRSQALETSSKLIYELYIANPTLTILDHHIQKMKQICLSSMVTNYVSSDYILTTFRKLISATKGTLLNEEQFVNFFKYLKSVIATENVDEIDTIFLVAQDMIVKSTINTENLYKAVENFISSCRNSDSLTERIWKIYSSLCYKASLIPSAPISKSLIQKYLSACLQGLQQIYIRQPDGKPIINDDNLSLLSCITPDIKAIEDIVKTCSKVFQPSWLSHIVNILKDVTIVTLDDYARQQLQGKQCEDDEVLKKDNSMFFTSLEEIIESIIAFGQVIYKIFRTSPFTRELLLFFVNSVCDRCLASSNEGMLKNGLYVIDDILEYFEQGELPDIWNRCLQIYLKHSISDNHTVRQAGCFGLGVWIKKSSVEEVEKFYNQIAQTLLQCLHCPPDEENEEHYGNAQDNVTAAIGHLIQKNLSSHKALILFNEWLDYLPLKFDKTEGKEQHDLLFKWFSVESPVFNPLDKQGRLRLTKVLKIFAELYNTRKLASQEMKKKIEIQIKQLMKNPIIQEHSNEIWELLNQQDRGRLLEIQMNEIHITQ